VALSRLSGGAAALLRAAQVAPQDISHASTRPSTWPSVFLLEEDRTPGKREGPLLTSAAATAGDQIIMSRAEIFSPFFGVIVANIFGIFGALI